MRTDPLVGVGASGRKTVQNPWGRLLDDQGEGPAVVGLHQGGLRPRVPELRPGELSIAPRTRR